NRVCRARASARSVARSCGWVHGGVMFDLHVHTAPDVQERACDDTTMARRYEDSGFTGFVLKGHFADTTARAAAMSQITSVRAYGGIVLNSQVGGLVGSTGRCNTGLLKQA